MKPGALFAFLAIPGFLFPQSLPTVTGAVSAASFSSPIAPGSLISIFGSKLAAVTESAPPGVTPLPTMIGGTSVSIDGIPAPLWYVSPGQINAQAPSSVSATAGMLTTATVTVTTQEGSSPPAKISVLPAAPGAFTSASGGCGQAVAINVTPSGTTSLNSRANSAAPGDYLEVYGTGLGSLAQQPANGAASAKSDPAASGAEVSLAGAADSVFFGGSPNDSSAPGAVVSYAGGAPTLVGVDQINLQIPAGTRNGCAVPMLIESGQALSPIVTVSINATRGACVDPPQQSYGQVSLVKTMASGTANDGETDNFTAIFPEAPGLAEPAPPVLNTSSPVTGSYSVSANSRACAVPGYSGLSAGTIQIQTPGKSIVAAQPQSRSSGLVYQTALPAGFIGPASYTISSGAGSPVSFQGTITPGAPIAIQTKLTPGTVLSSANPPTIMWTGGDANSVIRITLVGDVNAAAPMTSTYYVAADKGTVTLPIYSASATNVAELIFDVLPAPGVASTIGAQGITGSVQLSWDYRYIFGGLTTQYSPTP